MQTQLSAGRSSLMDRLMGVITLKAPIYREIADDTTATGQAAIIVILTTLVAGFFQGLVGLDQNGNPFAQPVAAIIRAIVGVILGLVGWAFAAWVLAFVARTFFQGKTNTLEMLRVTGFVSIFSLISIITVLALASPILFCLVALIGLVVAILQLIGYIIGVREAAEFSTANAVITAIVAAIVQFIIVVVIGGAIAAVVVAAIVVTGGAGG